MKVKKSYFRKVQCRKTVEEYRTGEYFLLQGLARDGVAAAAGGQVSLDKYSHILTKHIQIQYH